MEPKPYRAERVLDDYFVIMQGNIVQVYFLEDEARAIADMLNRRQPSSARKRRRRRRQTRMQEATP
jgi:hypothetical protein